MYGRIIISIAGTILTSEEQTVIQHPLVLGVILFPENHSSLPQLRCLIGKIQYYAHKAGKEDMPIFTDQEGGSIQFLKKGFTKLPALKTIGEAYDKDRASGLAYAQKTASQLAKELKPFGIIPLCPVLDPDHGNKATSQKNRCFHKEIECIKELAIAFSKGLKEHDLPSTGKHFPDHGYAQGDTHNSMIYDDRIIEEIQGLRVYRQDILPHLQAIMMAHIIYPGFDDKPPALSRKWIHLLRDHLKFKGVILTDCLSMKGTGESKIVDKIKNYLQHVDVAIVCHLSPSDYLFALSKLPKDLFATSEIHGRIKAWTSSTLEPRKALSKIHSPRVRPRPLKKISLV